MEVKLNGGKTVTPLAIGTMIVICGIVWGGLLTLIVHAVRSESAKKP